VPGNLFSARGADGPYPRKPLEDRPLADQVYIKPAMRRMVDFSPEHGRSTHLLPFHPPRSPDHLQIRMAPGPLPPRHVTAGPQPRHLEQSSLSGAPESTRLRADSSWGLGEPPTDGEPQTRVGWSWPDSIVERNSRTPSCPPVNGDRGQNPAEPIVKPTSRKSAENIQLAACWMHLAPCPKRKDGHHLCAEIHRARAPAGVLLPPLFIFVIHIIQEAQVDVRLVDLIPPRQRPPRIHD